MDSVSNWDILNTKEKEAPSTGIKSLEYLHLLETRNDLQLPNNVDDEVCLSLFLDPSMNFTCGDRIYTLETDSSPCLSDFPYYNLGCHFEERKRFHRNLSKHGLETGDLIKNLTYDYRFDFYRYKITDIPLRLGSADLKVLLSRKSALDLQAWGGHLFKEFRLKVLNSKNKGNTFASVLNLIEKCGYCKYHEPYVLERQLELYLELLDLLHSRGEMPTYSRNIVQLLQLFTHNRKVVKLLLRFHWVDIRNYVNILLREKYSLFNLWNHSSNESSECLTDLSIRVSMKNAEILLLNGGTTRYSDEAYKSFRKYVRLMIDSSTSEKFIENLDDVELSDRIKYRCLQTIFIYSDTYHPFYIPPLKSVIKLIWKNISEPFLTKEDFLSLSVTAENSSTERFLCKVWNWYMSNVCMKDIPLKHTPRTLYQISAVAIRNRLTKCFNFPDGIAELPLPKSLKKDLYLSVQENNISIIPI